MRNNTVTTSKVASFCISIFKLFFNLANNPMNFFRAEELDDVQCTFLQFYSFE